MHPRILQYHYGRTMASISYRCLAHTHENLYYRLVGACILNVPEVQASVQGLATILIPSPCSDRGIVLLWG